MSSPAYGRSVHQLGLEGGELLVGERSLGVQICELLYLICDARDRGVSRRSGDATRRARPEPFPAEIRGSTPLRSTRLD